MGALSNRIGMNIGYEDKAIGNDALGVLKDIDFTQFWILCQF